MSARFEILAIPGSGSHATVCIVRDHESGQIRALKVLREAFDAESSEARRVRDEGRILARLRHPFLPRVYEQLELAGRQVLVMDFVDGPSLAWLIRRMGALPTEVGLGIVHDVAVAVHHAYTDTGPGGHPSKLVHRDLSLNNILLDLHGRIRVLDFGLARAEFLDRETHTMISLRGSPGYTAPEGLRSIRDNPALDVYSLGIGLLTMLTGHLPVFSRKEPRHAASLAEMMELLALKIQAPSVLELAQRMCAYRPRDRPTMEEVVRALEPQPTGVLSRFAKEQVRSLHEARQREDPLLHEAYSELAFLEGIEVGVGTAGPGRGDQMVRRFLERPRWAERTADLAWILKHYPDWSAAPFIEQLAAPSAWWTFGRSQPEPRVRVVALCALSQRQDDEVSKIAQAHAKSRHLAVASVATSILKGEVLSVERAERFDWSK